jgi:hypothetical protein
MQVTVLLGGLLAFLFCIASIGSLAAVYGLWEVRRLVRQRSKAKGLLGICVLVGRVFILLITVVAILNLLSLPI